MNSDTDPKPASSADLNTALDRAHAPSPKDIREEKTDSALIKESLATKKEREVSLASDPDPDINPKKRYPSQGVINALKEQFSGISLQEGPPPTVLDKVVSFIANMIKKAVDFAIQSLEKEPPAPEPNEQVKKEEKEKEEG